MKDLELTLRVRNNRLKQRRDELGMSQQTFAKAAGVSVGVCSALECLRESPMNKQGDWRQPVLAIAEFHGVSPEELFPPAVLQVEQHVAIRKLDAAAIGELVTSHQRRAIESVDTLHDQDELRDKLEEACASLTSVERDVLRRRYCVDSDEPETLAAIADDYDVSKTRIGQLEMGALRKLRSHNAGVLELFYDPEATDPFEKQREQCKARELEWVKIANDVHDAIDEMQRELTRGPRQPSILDRLNARGYHNEQAVLAVVESLDHHKHQWRKLSYAHYEVNELTVSISDNREPWWHHSFVVPLRSSTVWLFNKIERMMS